MKYLKRYEGILYDNFLKHYPQSMENATKMTEELLDVLMEPISDIYDISACRLSYDKLQAYYQIRYDENPIPGDEKLVKLLKSLSAKLEDYGLNIFIGSKKIYNALNNGKINDLIPFDKLSKNEIVRSIIIRDNRHPKYSPHQ